MAKNANEQKLMNATEIAGVFAKYFDHSVLQGYAVLAERGFPDGILDDLNGRLRAAKKIDNSSLDGAFIKMFEDLKYALENPQEPSAKDFLDSFKFMSQFRNFIGKGTYTASQLYAKSFMNQIDRVITDVCTKGKLLLKMRHIIDLDEQYLALLVKNSEHFTTKDWKDVLDAQIKKFSHSNFDVFWTILDQLERATVAEIQQELSKKTYDIKKLEEITSVFQSAISKLYTKAKDFRNATEIQQRLNSIGVKYNLENILSMEFEKIAELPKSGYAQAAALEAENAELQRQSRQREAELQRQIEELKMRLGQKDQEIQHKDSVIRDKEQQIARLNTALAQSKGETAQVKSAKEKSEAALNRLLAATQRLRVGLFTRGVKDAQDVATLIQAERNGSEK